QSRCKSAFRPLPRPRSSARIAPADQRLPVNALPIPSTTHCPTRVGSKSESTYRLRYVQARRSCVRLVGIAGNKAFGRARRGIKNMPRLLANIRAINVDADRHPVVIRITDLVDVSQGGRHLGHVAGFEPLF